MYNHKEKTAHIRKLIKAAGIKARVRKYVACGTKYIQVFTPAHNSLFTADEIKAFTHIADCNKLTGARCSKIDPKHEMLLTGKQTWNFEFHGDAA